MVVLDGFLLLPVIQKGLFLGPKKSRKIRHANTGLPSSRFLPRMLFCVKVASSLTACAHSSLQSFSTSDTMKGPKTGPPGGTTFDPKRVHFWVPSEIYLLCARVQNWALSILNLVPPWALVLTPHSNTLLRRVVGIRPQTSASHIIATTSWQPGPRTVQDSCHGCCLC